MSPMKHQYQTRTNAVSHAQNHLDYRAFPPRLAHNGLVGGSSPPGPTTQSCATGDFLKVYERPRIGGDLCDGSFSETASLQSAGRFCERVLGYSEVRTLRARVRMHQFELKWLFELAQQI